MDMPFDHTRCTIEEYVDDATFRLLSVPGPKWYINPDIKVTFKERPAWDAVVADAPLSVAPGLDKVLSSDKPPPITFFASLPKPSKTHKQWGTYGAVLKKSGFPDIVYIGSGTNSVGRVDVRVRVYITGASPFGKLVRNCWSSW
ncbi:hypothetical protein BDZ85DRAFT_261520 [Elsinoe ampelina]|uniref:Uncharacterized protein n=1 Tax=Elsinoe ampelina TaxID=302913 RepID=A0A6A6GCE8_9PEZI|nr:hypothetical protein BDZ85DRAFT_261520 [Elsinoe ampelina]